MRNVPPGIRIMSAHWRSLGVAAGAGLESMSAMTTSSFGRSGRRCQASDKGRRFLAEPAIEDAAQRTANQRRDPEQPELRQRQPPTNKAGPVERAGLTEVLVIGMPTRWISVRPRPMASGANPTGALPWVAPMMMNRNIMVSTTSATKPEIRLYWPGECAP